MKKNSKITLESVDRQALWDKIYQVLKQEALDFSKNYTSPLDLWDIDVITREDRDEYQAGDTSQGSEYGYAVKWGYDAAVDLALEDHEWTYVMVYEEPESEEELKNQFTFDDVVNIITESHLKDRYEEIQCGSFEHGHFKYIVFVEKESKAKATLNENTKVTLTLKQLKALVKEAKKVKQPRYTIAQYCDMKGLDADKLMAAMKAHWSILSPPLTDRTTFPEHALDTYAERYADEMNADTPIEVQADDEAEDEEEVEVDKPYRDCGVTIHTTQGDREYGMKDRSETKWFDSKEDLHRWLECGANETEGSEQDHYYSMLYQLSRGFKVVDYNKF